MTKRGRKRRSTRRRSPKRRTRRISRPKRKRTVAKKKRSSGRSKGIRGIFNKSGLVGKAAMGIGAATVATLVVDRVAPQFSPIAAIGASFLGGGLVGAAANLFVSGGLGGLTGLFGGVSSASNGGESL